MAKKRSLSPKVRRARANAKRLSPATRRQVLALEYQRRARKSARTRKRNIKEGRVKAPTTPAGAHVPGIGELVLYEAPEVHGASAFEEWDSLPVLPTVWVAVVQFRYEGVVLAEETLVIPESGGVAWDAVPAPTFVRNAIRPWLAGVVAELKAAGRLPESETPQASLQVLALRRV